MEERFRILIVSDIHYASNEEKLRVNYEWAAVPNPLTRALVRFYRYFFWLRDPFAHNHLLERVLNPPFEPQLVVANGDYSCDSAFIGVADPASRKSAVQCLGQLRDRFGSRFLATFGDHELGKTSLAGGCGGLRLESWHAARRDLHLEPFWSHRIGKYLLIGITSTLVALPVFEGETLPEELPRWRELQAEHLARIHHAFESLAPDDRVILFCHDPTALPFLHQQGPVRERLPQIECTILGHLHSPLLMWQSRILAGIPTVRACGKSIARITSALHRARSWRHFKIVLCPSLAGIELFKRGGFYRLELDPSGAASPEFHLYPLNRS